MTGGCLYVCATPIGNLEDITLRVLRTLGEVDLIAAEDTRRTRQLLNHFDLSTPLISLHEHNETARAAHLVSRLQEGQSIALVTDAGLPGISDPGGLFIRAVIDADVPLTVLPGPSAFATALVGSGLPTEKFQFEGFLPRQRRRRQDRLRQLQRVPETLVFYEAPHRVVSTLEDMLSVLGNRSACVARELTKAYEEWQRGPLAEVVAHWDAHTPRGEFVLIVAGASPEERRAQATSTDPEGVDATPEHIVRFVLQHMDAGTDKKSAVKRVARQLGLPRRTVYRAAIRIDAEPSDDPKTSKS